MTGSVLEYSVATSWEDTLLEDLAALNTSAIDASVSEVFGSHRATPTGTGRPTYRLPDVSSQAFERHLKLAHRLGIRFNYVLNAPSFGGREADRKWWHEVGEFLDQLVQAGVDCVTIANEELLRFVRHRFPALQINVSLIAGVDTVEAARHFNDLGVDVIVLSPFTVNRDFATLVSIRAAVNCKLELYANIPCLNHCPMRKAHYQYSGRASRTDERSGVASDPFLMKCSSAYLSSPVELLRSPFIRPEDAHVYRDLGIDVIKLSDRSESSAFLLRTAQAYLEQRYNGDLFELIFRSGRKFRAGLGELAVEVEDLPLSVQINNGALSAMNFIEQVQQLKEPALTEFYQRATSEAVSLPDNETLARWRAVLCR